ncbi:hypothetical protein [Methylomagnum sp.]
MNTIAELETAIAHLSPDELAEFSEWFQSFISKQANIQRDIELINRHADELNREAEDVITYTLPSLEDFRKDLPWQTISAGDFCREMREAEIPQIPAELIR